MKRVFDIVLSSVGLVISLPFCAIIILCIIIENGWPIFYVQERVGKNGTIFKTLKFRSMIKNAEKDTGPIQAKIDDERITRVGKILRATALDELPQLFNILKGEMSFVGPRPLRIVECEVGKDMSKSIYDFEGFKERLSIPPGLTGAAQIFAVRDVCREEKFKYDVWYVKNKSILLDIKLIILSFLVTFMGEWETREIKIHRLGQGLREKIERGINNSSKAGMKSC